MFPSSRIFASRSTALPLLLRQFMSSASSKVGFIGLGNMGGHMARNLVRAGRSVVVFDINEESVAKLKSDGASSASTPAEIASQCDTIITMLPSNPHVKEVYMGKEGIFSKVQPKSLLIDASTVDPAVSREVAAEAGGKGVSFIDAPVSGGVGGAEAGTLTFMVGGKPEDYEASKAVLSDMGKNIVYCGGNGSGEVVKLCNNLILAISMIGVSEAMNLGVKLGVDPKLMASVINTSTGRCWSSDTYNPCPGVFEGVPSSKGYQGGFGSNLMKKDLGLAISAAKANAAETPLGEHALRVYEDVDKAGRGDLDFGVVYKCLADGGIISKE